MMRSLFSGVSGLKNHQTRMDVIGNNISNVNTTGFKSGRVNFSDMLNQTLTGASAPADNRGGVNAKQIGLGSSVASVDLMFTNGSVQSTGKNTDLCLSGNGLFVVQEGDNRYYTRNGTFEFDADGNYVQSGNGLFVQGWMAQDGVLSTTGDVSNITIPSGKSMESQATSIANYTKNLNAETTGYEIASIIATYEDGTSKTLKGYPSGTMTLTLDGSGGIGTAELDATSEYDFTTGDSVKDKKLFTSKIDSVTAQATGKVDLVLTPGGSINSIQTKVGTDYVDGLTVKDLTSGTFKIGDTYTITGTIASAGVTTSGADAAETVLTVDLTTPATTPVTTVKIAVPTPPDFAYSDGDTVSFDLKIGEIDAATGAKVKCGDAEYTVCAKDIDNSLATDGTTTDKLAVKEDKQAYAYYGRSTDGNVKTVSREEEMAKSVSILTTDGKTITGIPGESYNAGETFYPAVASSITVYDSLGASHDVPILLTKTDENKWALSLANGTNSYSITESDGSVTNITLTSTDLVFNTNGSYASGEGSLFLTYGNGAADQTMQINLAGVTQYAGSSTVSADADGHAAGSLASVAIDSSGVITGTYTNGVKQVEAQIAVAQFNNASGLTKTGDSLYQISNNSGEANIKTATDLGVTITPSALEMSNVDVANEFTDMIVTQRGFQSNSKIITVSDEMLETLINLKR